MRFRDVLALPCLANARVIAGDAHLDRDVRWVHVLDNPDAVAWARPGQFVLTTGYAWPREAPRLRRLFRDLAEAGVAGVGLAVPQFFETFPDEVRADAPAHDLVLLEVPWEVPFAQVTEEVHTALLGEQTRVIERSEAIHRALTRAAASGASLEVLARTLAAETGHDVAIVGANGDPLAVTVGAAAVAAIASEATRPATSNTTAEERTVPSDAAPAGWAVRAAVQVQTETVATVWLLGRNGRPGPLERRAVEHAALVTALRLAHQRELGTIESRLRRSFVDDLIEGRLDAVGLVAERAHAAGFSAREPHQVAIVELGLDVPLVHEDFARREAALERVRDTLLRSGASDLLTTSSNRLIVLLPGTVAIETVWTALNDAKARMAVARPYVGLDGVRRGFAEARASLPHVAPGSWACFDDLVLPRAVQGDREAQRDLVEGFEAPLRAGRGGALWTETLFVLASHEFVLNATAEALGIHISTLRHRLERIEDRLGLDLHDPDVRLRLRVAGYVRGLAHVLPT